MARSEAQKRADKKYQESNKYHYKTISTKVHIDKIEKIAEAANKAGVSTSKFLVLSAEYCIDNNVKFNDKKTI